MPTRDAGQRQWPQVLEVIGEQVAGVDERRDAPVDPCSGPCVAASEGAHERRNDACKATAFATSNGSSTSACSGVAWPNTRAAAIAPSSARVANEFDPVVSIPGRQLYRIVGDEHDRAGAVEVGQCALPTRAHARADFGDAVDLGVIGHLLRAQPAQPDHRIEEVMPAFRARRDVTCGSLRCS